MTVHDSRIPPFEDCVVGAMLHKRAAAHPDRVFAIFEDGDQWTYADMLVRARRAAAGLRKLGVNRGDHVLSWLPNGKEAILTWFGLNMLGAVYVPVNTSYRGGLLEHVVALSDARLIVVHAQLMPRLADVDRAALTDAIVIGGDATAMAGLTSHPETALQPDEEAEADEPVAPWDNQYIIFTSGTTGPSKAVLSPYLQAYAMACESYHFLTGEDRVLVNLPLFHVGGTIFVYVMLHHGGSVVIENSFRTEDFWESVREKGVTSTCLVGAMTPFLLKLPPSNRDQDHPMRSIVTIPWNEDSLALGRRYGVDMFTGFNMTEISSPIVSEANPPALGTCGKARDGVEVRVVDENDCEVAPGTVGELIVRTDRPWAMNSGYYKNPEATAKAWRNGWFHTGDAFKYDEHGNFFFVDRIKDAIRRRGENISSFEVESEVTQYPAVREAAAIPVPSEFNEDEVMVIVSPAPGESIDAEALFRFLEPRMAHFMLPRYIRVVDDLPKTPTQKVQKVNLKDEGITADTWDREAAGIKVKREAVG
ncbi:AMP-binding protein [Minwuia sp.]|uniref:AMP-binding protein n=1 Tax=Minwuia sp. TaxID=2493630 RepID=UPI003A901653